MFNVHILLLLAACLPFKPCTTPSPVTPVGSSGGKKRRVAPSNLAARCAAKNMKVEPKKAPEKSMADPSDDKVVSSSCEVDCPNAVCWSASPKTLPSRSSLDYFVHATQKLEVTTSSTDGDLVDLTVEDESASEAVALSSNCVTAESDVADIMSAAVSNDCATEILAPVSAELDIKTVTSLAVTPAEEPAEVEKVDDGNKNNCCINDDEVQSSQHEDAQKPACSITGMSHYAPYTGSIGSTCAEVPDGRQNVDELDSSVHAQAIYVEDGQDTSNNDPRSDADDDVDVAESSVCDNTDNGDDADVKLSEAKVVLLKLDEENMKAANCDEKSEVSTTSADMKNSDDKKVTGNINEKPKVR